MGNWMKPTECLPKNNQRVLICRSDKFIIMGQFIDGNFHDTRYSRELTKSVVNGNFFWMPLPSIDSIKDLLV